MYPAHRSVAVSIAVVVSLSVASAAAQVPAPSTEAPNGLDVFMEKVLAKREVNRLTLKQYILATEELTRGHADLSKRLAVRTNDELGSLESNLNRVFAKIHSLAAGVQRSAFHVNASSGEISSVRKQMHDGAKEQAGKISNSTAAVVALVYLFA